MPSVLALVASLAAMLLVAPPPSAGSCFHGTRLQARSVAAPLEARAVAAPDYSYSGERGPFNWHGIKDAYKQCARGRNQSPVDIYPGTTGIKTVAASSRPMLNYPTQPNGQATNLGATIQTDASGTMTYEGVEYRLLQWHFHTPSEHRLRNLHHPFEVHFVHERVGSGTGPSLAVVGVFMGFTDGATGAQPMENVLNKAPEIAAVGASTSTGELNYSAIMAHVRNNEMYEYSGSLTTPPCSEGVKWLVSANPIAMSLGGYGKGKQVIGYNSRPSQNQPGAQNMVQLACKNL